MFGVLAENKRDFFKALTEKLGRCFGDLLKNVRECWNAAESGCDYDF